MKVGEKIRRIRELLEVAPEEFAARLGVSVQAVEILETNLATIGKQALLRIAKALQITVADIEDFKAEADSLDQFKSYRNKVINERAHKEFRSLIDRVIGRIEELLDEERAANARMQQTIARLEQRMAKLETALLAAGKSGKAFSPSNR